MPVQTFKHNKLDVCIKFRQIGDRTSKEAVLFFPSIYETEASAFRIAPLFEKENLRFISINTYNHAQFTDLMRTIRQLCLYLHLEKVHLVGCDLGGFICLQIQAYPQFPAKIETLTLINSYTENSFFIPRSMSSFSVFGYLIAKSKLEEELEQSGIGYETKSYAFVHKEIEYADKKNAAQKIQLRMSQSLPLKVNVDKQRIMSIEPLDRKLQIITPFISSSTFSDCKIALMKKGGDFPHLEEPEDLFTYLLCHIRKFMNQDADAQNQNQENQEN
ncbi:putative acid cluster protein 33 [Histomonas meleagridis]|uniref:putative acid cluster protein 33-like n=1 Tax=Histomonas meleagridis TaxID=135588 RepID=UPI0035595217|nr:putative acid cluster protein 33 [Histomonas meleagridis]KAH0801072.1 putative acid cluster protein 33-like [Histomonas meleagridis]